MMQLDQAALDRAYDQRNFAPNMQEVLASYASRSDVTRAELGEPITLQYGKSPIERADFYKSTLNTATQIFVHGGAWRGGAAKNYGFLADLFCSNGINLIVLDFDSVQKATHGLTTMVDQVRSAIAWIYKHSNELGIDENKLHLFGHSSGAHLMANVLTTQWQNYDLPPNIIKGATCCSGIYDLKPVRLSSRNSYLDLSDEVEQSLSPVRHASLIKTPLIVAYGTHESPEFIRQSQAFAQAINQHRAADEKAQLVQLDGLNHFEVLAEATSATSLLRTAMLAQVHGSSKSDY